MPIELDEVSKLLNIDFPEWVDRSDKEEILNEIGDFLVNEIVSYTESGVSAVDGWGKFQKLSKDYAKSQKAGDTTSNLDLNGDMLGALTYEIVGGKLKVGIFDELQAKKAYNHNVGDTLPKRPFIPNPKQEFDPDIMSGVDDLLQNFLDGLDYNPKNIKSEDNTDNTGG